MGFFKSPHIKILYYWSSIKNAIKGMERSFYREMLIIN